MIVVTRKRASQNLGDKNITDCAGLPRIAR